MPTDINKKLTKTPWNDPDSGVDPKYPYLRGERDSSGKYEFAYSNPRDMDNVSTEKYESTGSYSTTQGVPLDQKKGNKPIKAIQTSLNVGESRTTTRGGGMNQTEGHSHTGNSSTTLTETDGDNATQTGRDTLSSTARVNINVDGGTTVRKTNPGSGSLDMNITHGDRVESHEGDVHQEFEGDHMTSVRGNDIRMIREGEYGVHVQEGNYDVDIKGLARIFSEDEMLIESLTKITIKVGNSTIILRPDNIELDSPRIDLN